MKNLTTHTVLILVFALFCFANKTTNASEVTDSTLNVTYIGATGYLIESTNKKVFIEPTCGDAAKTYGYPFANEAILGDIQNGTGVFTSADIIFISHFHGGHIDAKRTVNCIKANPNAVVITTAETKTSIQNATDDFAAIEDQIFVPNIGSKETMDTSFNDIAVTLTNVHHANPQPATELLHIYLTMDDLNVAFYLEYHEDDVTELDTKTKNIDLCFLDGKSYAYEAFRDMLEENFDFGFTILTHSNNIAAMENSVSQNIDKFPNVSFLRNSMEKVSYSFNGNVVLVDTLNHAPSEMNAIKNDTSNIDESINYVIPADIFEDADGDEITYTLTTTSGNEIPNWLSFDASTLTITGTSSSTVKQKLRLTATDPSNAYSHSDFYIIVEETVSTPLNKNNELNVSLFPNPNNGSFTIDLSGMKGELRAVRILDLTGKEVYSENCFSNNLHDVNLKNLSNGTYIVSLLGQSCIKTIKMVKQ